MRARTATPSASSTLGRGPSGFYINEAQLDFWEVWHVVASSYRLDPNRTILSGYSMGGIGSDAIAEAHPDLFARTVGLAGARRATARISRTSGGFPPTWPEARPTNSSPSPTRWPWPTDSTRLGYRYRWLLYPAEDHIALELQDGFSDAATYMGDATRVTRPGHIDFRWSPASDSPALGFGTTGAYWLRHLAARSASTDAVIDAFSAAQPDPAVTDQRSRNVLVPGDPSPAIATTLSWTLGSRPAGRPELSLSLANVSAASVLLGDAGLSPGQPYQLGVTTDGPVTLTLVGASGSKAVHLGAGSWHLHESG